MTALQHRFYKTILSTTHVHLDEHNCLEVLILRGKGKDLKKISDRLIGTRGVKTRKAFLNHDRDKKSAVDHFPKFDDKKRKAV